MSKTTSQERKALQAKLDITRQRIEALKAEEAKLLAKRKDADKKYIFQLGLYLIDAARAAKADRPNMPNHLMGLLNTAKNFREIPPALEAWINGLELTPLKPKKTEAPKPAPAEKPENRKPTITQTTPKNA